MQQLYPREAQAHPVQQQSPGAQAGQVQQLETPGAQVHPVRQQSPGAQEHTAHFRRLRKSAKETG